MNSVKLKPHLHSSFIDPRAFAIVERLQKQGFKSYLVGGCVRDLLLGIEPKDFDIATSALPQEVKKIIPHSYIIGKRFKLVLAKRGADQFEIATFRRDIPENLRPSETTNVEDLVIKDDNFFGTPEEDARRRDFTINGLFYDPVAGTILDWVNAGPDLEGRWVRMIGHPPTRILEDPIRSLRAIRLAHKIQFSLESSLRAAIAEYAHMVALTALPRRREEYLKLLRLPQPDLAFLDLWDLGLIDSCLPSLKHIFLNPDLEQEFLFALQKKSYGVSVTEPVQLMFPLAAAFWKLHDKNEDLTAQFLQTEFGAYKAEIQIIMSALRSLNHIPAVHFFKKRSRKRKLGFLEQPWMSLVWDWNFKNLGEPAGLDLVSLAEWENEFAHLAKDIEQHLSSRP
jgi:poly(A) polymerase